MTNKKMEKTFQTYKSILIKDSKYKGDIMFFARRIIQNYNKNNYNKREQNILDGLLDYYKKPTKKRACC